MNPALIFEDNQEEDIDQMISDARTHEDNQGVERNPDDVPLELRRLLKSISPEEQKLLRKEKVFEQARQENVLNRKRRKVRGLLTSLNRLSASLFAAISVAERQITVLQELYTLLSKRDQIKTKAREGGYPLRQNSSFKDIAPTLTPSENPEQLWPGDLVAIDRVVRERKSFIKKIKVLVENMGARREAV